MHHQYHIYHYPVSSIACVEHVWSQAHAQSEGVRDLLTLKQPPTTQYMYIGYMLTLQVKLERGSMGWELEELEQAAHLVAAEDSCGSCGEESSGSEEESSEDGSSEEGETESELDSSTRTTHTEITSKSGSEKKSSIEDSECDTKVVCEVATDFSESLSQTEGHTSGQGSSAVCQAVAATNKDPNSLSHEQTHHSTCEIDRLSEGLRDLLTLKQPTTQATEGVTPSSTHQKLIEELN